MSTIDGIGDFFSSIVVGFLWTSLSPAIGLGFGGILAVLAAVTMFTINLKNKQSILYKGVDMVNIEAH
jgi:hypothetical protein